MNVRWVGRIGTPGDIIVRTPEELLQMLHGNCKVFAEGNEIEDLSTLDQYDDITVVEVPGDPVTAIAIGALLVPLIVGGTIVAVDNLKGQQAMLQARMERFSKIDVPTPAASIRGSRNGYRANGRMPLLFGEHYLVPDQAGVPFSSYDNEEQWYHQLFCLGYQNVEYSDPKIGETPITEFDATLSEGITEYDRLVSEVMIGTRLKVGQPITKRSVDNVIKINIGITFPSGLKYYDDDGNPQPQTVKLRLGHRPVGGTWAYTEQIITDQKNVVRRMYSFPVAKGQHEVSVEKLEPVEEGSLVMAGAYLDVLQYEVDIEGSTDPVPAATLSNCKILSLSIRASDQLKGVVDRMSVIGRAKYRDWNGGGTGAPAWLERNTRNPASALLYLLTDPRVNKKAVSDDKINWPEFEAFHSWCDTKGFFFDAVIAGDYTIGDISKMICSAGRAVLTTYNGVYGVRIEQAATAVDFQLTPRNTRGSMSLSKSFNSQVKNLKCRFIDRTSGYAETARTCSVTPAGDIVFDNPQPGETEEVSFTGITDPNHVMKIAAFELARLTRRVVQYTVPQDWEQMTAFPGAVGYLANDMFLYGLGSARVSGVTGPAGALTGVVLDAPMTMEAGKSYSVLIRMNDPSDGIRTYPLQTVEGTTDTFVFASAVSEDIEKENLVIFGEQGAEGIRVICESISQGPDGEGTLSLFEYCEDIYQADSGTIPPWSSGITIPPEDSQAPVYPIADVISDMQSNNAESLAGVPTYEELTDGFEYESGGELKGTTVPEVVDLGAEGAYRAVVLRWSRQSNLTNFDRYEVQVSPDGTEWYSLQTDGTDYKDQLNVWTPWATETMVHAGIPLGGSPADPQPVTLYYRARRVTKADIASAACAAVEAEVKAIQGSDIAANSITANQLSANAVSAAMVQTGLLGASEAVVVGFSGIDVENPQEGDTRIVIDSSEVKRETYNGTGWISDISLGGEDSSGNPIDYVIGSGISQEKEDIGKVERGLGFPPVADLMQQVDIFSFQDLDRVGVRTYYLSPGEAYTERGEYLGKPLRSGTRQVYHYAEKEPVHPDWYEPIGAGSSRCVETYYCSFCITVVCEDDIGSFVGANAICSIGLSRTLENESAGYFASARSVFADFYLTVQNSGELQIAFYTRAFPRQSGGDPQGDVNQLAVPLSYYLQPGVNYLFVHAFTNVTAYSPYSSPERRRPVVYIKTKDCKLYNSTGMHSWPDLELSSTLPANYVSSHYFDTGLRSFTAKAYGKANDTRNYTVQGAFKTVNKYIWNLHPENNFSQFGEEELFTEGWFFPEEYFPLRYAGKDDFVSLIDKEHDTALIPSSDFGKSVILGGAEVPSSYGDSIIPVAGPRGPQGETGPEGPQGPRGIRNVDGGRADSIYTADQVIDGGHADG